MVRSKSIKKKTGKTTISHTSQMADKELYWRGLENRHKAGNSPANLRRGLKAGFRSSYDKFFSDKNFAKYDDSVVTCSECDIIMWSGPGALRRRPERLPSRTPARWRTRSCTGGGWRITLACRAKAGAVSPIPPPATRSIASSSLRPGRPRPTGLSLTRL